MPYRLRLPTTPTTVLMLSPRTLRLDSQPMLLEVTVISRSMITQQRLPLADPPLITMSRPRLLLVMARLIFLMPYRLRVQTISTTPTMVLMMSPRTLRMVSPPVLLLLLDPTISRRKLLLVLMASRLRLRSRPCLPGDPLILDQLPTFSRNDRMADPRPGRPPFRLRMTTSRQALLVVQTPPTMVIF
jgi:hypothetical protein